MIHVCFAECIYIYMQVAGKFGPAVFSSTSTWLEPPLVTRLQHQSVPRKPLSTHSLLILVLSIEESHAW
jgi:hypothetical protein